MGGNSAAHTGLVPTRMPKACKKSLYHNSFGASGMPFLWGSPKRQPPTIGDGNSLGIVRLGSIFSALTFPSLHCNLGIVMSYLSQRNFCICCRRDIAPPCGEILRYAIDSSQRRQPTSVTNPMVGFLLLGQ